MVFNCSFAFVSLIHLISFRWRKFAGEQFLLSWKLFLRKCWCLFFFHFVSLIERLNFSLIHFHPPRNRFECRSRKQAVERNSIIMSWRVVFCAVEHFSFDCKKTAINIIPHQFSPFESFVSLCFVCSTLSWWHNTDSSANQHLFCTEKWGDFVSTVICYRSLFQPLCAYSLCQKCHSKRKLIKLIENRLLFHSHVFSLSLPPTANECRSNCVVGFGLWTFLRLCTFSFDNENQRFIQF